MQFHASRESEDGLSRRKWEFSLNTSSAPPIKVRLTRYVEFTRPTTRHKYRSTTVYESFRDFRNCPSVPPLPDDVKEEILRQVVDNLEISMPKSKGKPRDEG